MNSQTGFEERRKSPRFPFPLPLEYWETEDSCHGGLVGNLSKNGLLIYSIQDIPVGTDLGIKVFISNGYGFDAFKVFARVIWKGSERQSGWDGYKYGMEFISLALEDQIKIETLFRRHIQPEGLHTN
jgi:hypothetical protein